MSLVVDIAGRLLGFEVDAEKGLVLSLEGATCRLTEAQCGELVALARAGLRTARAVESGARQNGKRDGTTAPTAPVSGTGGARVAPSVEELERAVLELKDAARGQRRLSF